MAIFVDSNVFLRLYLGDIPTQTRKAARLLERAAKGELELRTTALVVFESAFTLNRRYKKPKAEIVRFLRHLLETPGLAVEQTEEIGVALDIYARKKISLGDAYTASWMKTRELTEIATFDRDFDKITGLQIAI